MTRTTARPAAPDVHALGEGPVWDPARQRLLWVDIVAGVVHEGALDAATGEITPTARHTFGTTVGAVAVAEDGELIVAEQAVLTRVDLAGRRTELARVLPPGRRSRLNDGAVDPAGRFLVGSLPQDDRQGEEVLVRLDGERVTVLDADLTVSNGLAWSPAGDVLYSVDTASGVVWARRYDPADGATGTREQAFTVTEGKPDGMCADAEGNLWVANWGLGRVEHRTPSGELLGTIETGAPHTSSVCFAGPALDTLVITTAVQGPAEPGPASGRLFTARADVPGLPLPYWRP
ncbi:SMP-30/gluconolactonase/LRE family protein [Nonomuraea sp. NPDC050310]|uniref:SMP-30/gluconolactonase/LRE family protein n=1 Tax=Nonomuraea sp. NPDC050310 TaxID=3154935 RepID=UPI0033E1811A